MFFNKAKVEVQYDPDVPLLGIQLQEFKAAFNRDVSTQIQVLFTIAALFRISKFLSIKS
jgi:hypothetical protein